MELKILQNQTQIQSLAEFITLDNRCSNMEKKTVFVIQTGTNDEQALMKTIQEVDFQLTDWDNSKKPAYLRLTMLDSYFEMAEKEAFEKKYQDWRKLTGSSTYDDTRLVFWFENPLWEKTYKKALREIIDEYQQVMKSELKLRNFVIILFKWISLYFPELFKSTKSLSKFPRLLYTGPIRTNEYLFFKLLAMCGCDVYAISPIKKHGIKLENISFYAQIREEEHDVNGKIEQYQKELIAKRCQKRKNQQKAASEPVISSPVAAISIPPPDGKPQELAYEELAKRASSIVMITVYDKYKKPFASGSGVLINKQGYILTNFHVVRGGVSFSVRLEEETEQKYTTELIKYHQENDLALLRIDPVAQEAIPVYRGSPLARGQKIVAIGSPLGLFNTVSDGIIAGFRTVNRVSMIQFTAPTSHGSSGGALLNLYGQLVGIVTAGYDDGQNLNLAVDFETVRLFLRGFI